VRVAEAHHALESHHRLLARELLASALYVALVLLAALVAVPVEQLPDDAWLMSLVLGTALGLILAHWFAFRLAAPLTAEDGSWSPTAAQEAGAQLAGGMSVAVLAVLPFVVFDGVTAYRMAEVLLVALPALTGGLIERIRGRSWRRAVLTGVVVLGLAVAVVVVKNLLGH
jgi:hypothetical protein